MASEPLSLVPPLVQHARPPGPYFRDGKYLIVMNHTVLPSRCPVTNEPAAHANPVRFRKVVWSPGSSIGRAMLGPLSYLASALGNQVKGRLSYPLSSRPKARIVAMRLLGCLLIAGGIGVAGWAASQEKFSDGSNSAHAKAPPEIYISLGLMLAGGIAFTLVNPLRVKDYRHGWFKVAGCSRGYLESLPEYSFDRLH